MSSISFIDPRKFEEGGEVKVSTATLKRIKHKRAELENDNFSYYVLPVVDESDMYRLLKGVRNACKIAKTKLLTGFEKKAAAGETKYKENIALLNTLGEAALSDFAWKEYALQYVCSFKHPTLDTTRLNDLAKEVVSNVEVKKEIDEAKVFVKRTRRVEQFKEEKKRKREKEAAKKALQGDDEEEVNSKGQKVNVVGKGPKDLATPEQTLLAIQKLPIGTLMCCVVEGITDFGVFCETYYQDTRLKVLAHISDVHRFGQTVTPEQMRIRYMRGDKVTGVVVKADVKKLQVKISFRDDMFEQHNTKTLHKHLRGDVLAADAVAEAGVTNYTAAATSSTQITLNEVGGEETPTKRYYDALRIVRKLNCKSHKNLRMTGGDRVKLMAEFLGLDVQRAFHDYIQRERHEKNKKRVKQEKQDEYSKQNEVANAMSNMGIDVSNDMSDAE